MSPLNSASDGDRSTWVENLVDKFRPNLSDCHGVRNWTSQHWTDVNIEHRLGGIEMNLRRVPAVCAVCQESDWTASFTSDSIVQEVQRRRASELYILEARFAHGVPLSTKDSLTLNAIEHEGGAGHWTMLAEGDTLPCVFAHPEASGGMVQGVNLLLGFDCREDKSDRDILFSLDSTGNMSFYFSGKAMTMLDERLVQAVKFTDPAKQ